MKDVTMNIVWPTVYEHSIAHEGLDWIEQCFTSPPTQYRLYGRRFFTGKKTQPTVSKYWRKNQEKPKYKIHIII